MFHVCMSYADMFLKFTFSKNKKSLPGKRSVSNSLDPDQARRYVGPDLDPNCLQISSVDDSGR